MKKSRNKKIAAIIPALNEEKTIGRVLKVLLSSKYLDEIILVDDGSVDKTAEIGEKSGVKVIKLPKTGGKGNAMKQGLKVTDAEIIIFFDADLKGLSKEHIPLLLNPIINKDVGMSIGIRDRLLGLPSLITKLRPSLALGGERALKREIFENIPEDFIQGFAVEAALNHYCKISNIPVNLVFLKKLNITIKERKWGFSKGFISRAKMIFEVLRIKLKLMIFKNNV